MLHINALHAEIHTSGGVFGRTLRFSKGLNIVRADNTSGKSSLFGAILYGLGFEELVGGRNERAMQSVYKSIVKELINGDRLNAIEHNVIQSQIQLELIGINNELITVQRTIVHNSIKPQAIEVFKGALITKPAQDYDRQPMYIHDKGAASHEELGFHKFLELFTGAKLPEILNQDGKHVKLFLPLIASAHFVEQKSGWSDFFASIPYYGIRDAYAKVFEYVLNFDVFKTLSKRQELQEEKKSIEERWKALIDAISATAKRGGGEITGITEAPSILPTDTRPYLRFIRDDRFLQFSELVKIKQDELDALLVDIHKPIEENLASIEKSLEELQQINHKYTIYYESLSEEHNQERERLRQYFLQRKNVDEDLRKNKDALKVNNLGLEASVKTSENTCPLCSSHIDDSLLSSNLEFTPMRIQENIDYLDAQLKMINAFIENLRKNVLEKSTRLSSLENTISRNRQRIRALKRDLNSDDRLPSEEFIERKIILERELNFYRSLREEFNGQIAKLYSLSVEFEKLQGKTKRLPKEYLSVDDKDKLTFFQNSFKELLRKFKFTTKPIETVKISVEKYTPVYEILHDNGLARQVDIRFESSASDFIRAQWAYYISLLKTSLAKGGNHFNLLVLDEPQQQSASTESLEQLLKTLQNINGAQVIVLASFQNSEEDYKDATKGLTEVNIIDFARNKEMFITKKSNDLLDVLAMNPEMFS